MSKLFTQNKKPINFFMKSHPKRKGLQQQIESRGGKLISSREPDAIELLPYNIGTPFASTVSRQVYSYNYIKDCIEANELLDLKIYSLLKQSLGKSGKRKMYKAEDEEKIRNYIESHAGSPFSIKFWKDALLKGLDLEHSADSLRYHWKDVMRKRRNNEDLGRQAVNRYDEESGYKKTKVENLVVPDEDELKSIRVAIVKGKRSVLDFSEINIRCEEEDVDEKFIGLVEICCKAAERRVSDQEVLRALVARGGKIKETIVHFTVIH